MSLKDDAGDLRTIAQEIEEYAVEEEFNMGEMRMMQDWAHSLREIAANQDAFLDRLERALGIRVKP